MQSIAAVLWCDQANKVSTHPTCKTVVTWIRNYTPNSSTMRQTIYGHPCFISAWSVKRNSYRNQPECVLEASTVFNSQQMSLVCDSKLSNRYPSAGVDSPGWGSKWEPFGVPKYPTLEAAAGFLHGPSPGGLEHQWGLQISKWVCFWGFGSWKSHPAPGGPLRSCLLAFLLSEIRCKP